MKKTVLGYDHRSVELRERAEKILAELGFEVINLGAKNETTTLPLQELIPKFVTSLQENNAVFGIISCGSGVGVEIGSNKFKGIRASLCHAPDQARLARQYDDANVLCLASWDELNLERVLSTWVVTGYDGSPTRRQMLDIFDKWGE